MPSRCLQLPCCLALLVLLAGSPSADATTIRNNPRDTPVMEALRQRNHNLLRELLMKGSPRNTPGLLPDSRHVSPLMFACQQGDEEAASILLDAGADASLAVPRHSADWLDWQPKGWTALCFARWKHLKTTEKRLVSLGVQPHPDCLGEADFLAAAEAGPSTRVSRLAKQAHGTVQPDVIDAAVRIALERKDLALMRAVLKGVRPLAPRHVMTSGKGWMAQALSHEDVAMLGLLMDAGVEPPLVDLAREGLTGLVGRALQAGASPDDEGDDLEDTPLSAAVEQGHGDIVRALLKAGADPNRQAQRGDLPLFRALQRLQRHEEDVSLLELLLKAGADVNARSLGGATVLQTAVGSCHPRAVALLLASKAPWDTPPGRGTTLYAQVMRTQPPCSEMQSVRIFHALRAGGVLIRDNDEKEWFFLRRQLIEHPAFEQPLRMAGLKLPPARAPVLKFPHTRTR
ncbi:ankyrin repeat domain-containing protein [Corallococcus llansteffanensis]|nr:ankyrin repeat domain-containing protein [Corallococcus llansteffanensis]